MGASSSKAARSAGSAARQYPTRPPPTSQAPTAAARPAPSAPPPAQGRPGPTVRPQPEASNQRSDAINLDASDPDFAQSLRSLGPVQPNPTLSPTSAFNPASAAQASTGPDPRKNPALAVLDARARLQDEAEREFLEAGRQGHEGRQFLDVYTIRQMLVMRDERGAEAGSIERALGLREGSVARLGDRGVLGLVQEVGRAQKGVDIV